MGPYMLMLLHVAISDVVSRPPFREGGAHMDKQLHAIADAQHGDLFLLYILIESRWQLGCIGRVHRVGAS